MMPQLRPAPTLQVTPMRPVILLLALTVAAPAQAQSLGNAIGALTACQVERDRLEELPAALRAMGWRRSHSSSRLSRFWRFSSASARRWLRAA